MTIAVLGGGASGMMAAITAATQYPQSQVLLLERHSRVGRKLLATGNGRCNLTNADLSPEHFHCSDPSFPAVALSSFDPLTWFHAQGLLTVQEPSGRIYPLSDSANSVLDVLRFALELSNLTCLTACEVRKVQRQDAGFRLCRTDGEDIFADKVIIACGGLAGTKLGGSMSGYQILRSFGHHCTKLHPSLVQVNTEDTLIKALKGVRADCAISLLEGDRVTAHREGELQFTMTGVSGPAVFELSRAVSTSTAKKVLLLNFLRDYSREEVLAQLVQRQKRFPQLPCEQLLTGMLHNRLGRTLLRATSVDPAAPLSALTAELLEQVVRAVTQFTLAVVGTMGMDCAQVTAGGIDVSEFDPATLESHLCPGLYACGEVLDVDGDCGGYNLHWAWTSGHLAGQLGGSHDSHS